MSLDSTGSEVGVLAAVSTKRSRSLTMRLVVPLVASSVLVVVLVVGLMYHMASSQLTDQVEARGRFLLNAVRYASETKAGYGDLLRQVQSLGGQRDVRFITMMYADTGNVYAATRKAWIGEAFAKNGDEAVVELVNLARKRRTVIGQTLPKLHAIVVAGPTILFNNTGELVDGIAVVAIDMAGVERDLLRQTTLLALIVLLAVAASAGLSVYLVHCFVLGPAQNMRRAVQRGIEVPIAHDDELGAVAGALNRAFTAAEQRQHQLDIAAGRMAALVRQFPAGVLVEDESRCIVLANTAYCDLFQPGVSSDELLGMSGPVLMKDAAVFMVDGEGVPELANAIIDAGVPVEAEQLHLRDGRIVERAYQPILGEGQLRGHMWIYRDVTERQRAAESLRQAKETAEDATRAKADFLATMSHEIRTPLNGVVGMADILFESHLTSDVRDQVDIIRASGRHLLSLINDILDYSRIEAGRLQLEQIDFDPWSVCEEILAMQVPAARAKGIALHLDIADSMPERLRGDPGRLKQIVVNLCGNAVKFTQAGSVRIRLSTRGTEHEPMLIVEVIDSGIGIPEHILPRLFQPFTQADTSTSRRFGGTGLGLAICKRLAELMGGGIHVTSTSGVGSTFRIELPCQRGGHPTSVELPAPLLDARVAVVLIDASVRKLAERCLRSLGIATADDDNDATLVLSDVPAAEACARAGVGSVPVIGVGPGDVKINGWSSAVGLPVRRVRLYDAMVSAISGHESSRAVGVPQWPHIRMLVADDVAVNRIVAKRMLERHGIAIDVVEDGQSAVNAVRAQTYHLVLMDCHMPGLDGFGATKVIVDGGEHPPIIALTADSLEGDRERCLAAGMDDYLAKPITIEALRGILERWLGPPSPVGSEA